MNTAPELKYTDRDVREDSGLKQLAIDYLGVYGGEFDPLVRAQNMLAMDGDLTTVMTRTVLNCMRNDERIASQLPAPKGYTMPTRPKGSHIYRPSVPEVRQPRMIQLQLFKLNYDYVVNLHPQAKWYHKIDHRLTVAYWYPSDWADLKRRNSIELREARAECGKNLDAYWWSRRRHILLADEVDAEDSGNKFCPRCEHGHRDAGWKP